MAQGTKEGNMYVYVYGVYTLFSSTVQNRVQLVPVSTDEETHTQTGLSEEKIDY